MTFGSICLLWQHPPICLKQEHLKERHLKTSTQTHTHARTHAGTNHPSFWLSLWNWCAPKPVSFPCIMPQGERLWMVVAATHNISCGSGCCGKHTHARTHIKAHTDDRENESKFRGTDTQFQRGNTFLRAMYFVSHTTAHNLLHTILPPSLSLSLTHTHARTHTHKPKDTQEHEHTSKLRDETCTVCLCLMLA